jgi:two-component sensor histidine kinase
VPLSALAYAQLAPFGTQISIDGEPLLVGNNFAQSFALIVHELATNAAKYGSLSAQQGTVSLAWSMVPTAEGQQLKTQVDRAGRAAPSLWVHAIVNVRARRNGVDGKRA